MKSDPSDTAAIRAVVFARAGHRCEACGSPFNVYCPGELDHFWGRVRVRQAVENCWALCRTCHRKKTENKPRASFWVKTFAVHLMKHGYPETEVERCKARLQVLEAKGFA